MNTPERIKSRGVSKMKKALTVVAAIAAGLAVISSVAAVVLHAREEGPY